MPRRAQEQPARQPYEGVTLIERVSRLGGQMHDYAAVVAHPHLLGHVRWLEGELARLEVEVRLGVEASVDAILASAPDVVILATGATTLVPPEAHGATIQLGTDVDVANGVLRFEASSSVVVYDHEGRLRGPSIASAIAASGVARVNLVFPFEAPAENLEPPNKPATFRRLAQTGVVCTPHHYLIEQQEGALRWRDSWSDRITTMEGATHAIFAGYRIAQTSLAQALLGTRPELEVHQAGDCRAPRVLRNAVSEGVRAGSSV